MTTTTSPLAALATRRRLLRRILGTGIVLALAAGGMAGVRHWDARTAATLADALAALGAAGAELDAAVADGEAALSESDGKVASEHSRTALEDALDAAGLDRTVAPGSRAEQANHATLLAAEVLEHVGRVGDAATAVRSDVASWLLAQAVETRAVALTALDVVIGSGEELLAATEGRVLPDDGPRETLRRALDVAITERDADVDPGDASAVIASAGRIEDAGAALAAAQAAVTGAHEAWQVAEAERVAAERAAAAAAAPKSRSGLATGGSISASTASGGASAPSVETGSSGSASTGTGDGHWVDEGDSWVDDLTLCVEGDQYGNSWSC